MKHIQLTEHERSSMAEAAQILIGMAEPEILLKTIGWYRFEMNRTYVPTVVQGECGSAGCLLGLAHLIECVNGRPETWLPPVEDYAKPYVKPDVTGNHPAYRVFYPDYDGYEHITPRMAGLAAIAFLHGVDEPDYTRLEGL